MTYKRVPIDLDDLRQSYDQGESVLKMARDRNVSRQVILRRLDEMGLDTRTGSEANRIRMARLTPEQRRAALVPANRTRRTAEIDFSPRGEVGHLMAQAGSLGRSRRVGKGEAELADLLVARGLTVERQLPVYGYNLDLSVGMVAVEVWWGEGYPLRSRHQARRVIDLADLGWSTILVWLSRRLPTGQAVDQVVSFLEEASRRPATVRPQYRVIRGDGELVAGGKADRDHLALVPPAEDGTY